MTDGVPHLFAAITSILEDMHGLAIEGQRLDNAPDMQRVLVSQMRMAIAAVDCTAGEITQQIGNGPG
ncbi:hypothetical protein FSZ31_11295 [Sphingorhabdus soli]|uniref:Uncharacterized protein n=1 Tax=Flavisphingopyxis soli TaxID=2601267 RepID=A0A5C6U5R6_9SPHN|nr:hypothetical protein [Sphingorhabdus soli]TXC68263.1 hypothetical protein FSZ31_11295 [Sphingorhabdus soli]